MSVSGAAGFAIPVVPRHVLLMSFFGFTAADTSLSPVNFGRKEIAIAANKKMAVNLMLAFFMLCFIDPVTS